MTRFQGVECSICHQPFQDGEDIVVCPICGTPHHRSCYEQLGHCVNESLHGTGFEFAAPHKEATFPCPKCGAACTEGLQYCENCGAPLSAAAMPPQTQQPTPGGMPLYGMPTGQSSEAQLSQFMQEDLDGIPMQDWVNFIGPSAAYYIYQFKRMDAMGRNTGFCWSAFMFAPLYFWYRKMWRMGLVAAALNLLLGLPANLLNLNSMLGIALPLAESTLVSLNTLFLPITLLVNVMWSLTAYSHYRKYAAAKIRKLRQEPLSPDEYEQRLAKSGGCSKLVMALSVFFVLLSFTAFLP